MKPKLKFETKEEVINGEKVLKYYINGKNVSKYTYDTLKPEYDVELHNKTKKDDKEILTSGDEFSTNADCLNDISDEECMCPICQIMYDIIDLIDVVGKEDLDTEYFLFELEDILEELYSIAYNDGLVEALKSIAAVSVDVAEQIMKSTDNHNNKDLYDSED